MYNDQKFFDQMYKNSGTLVYLSENDEPAPYSILKKTILDFLKISENERNEVWSSFGCLVASAEEKIERLLSILKETIQDANEKHEELSHILVYCAQEHIKMFFVPVQV